MKIYHKTWPYVVKYIEEHKTVFGGPAQLT